MKSFGVFLLTLGIGLGVYAYFMDISVSAGTSPYSDIDRVVNLSLMNKQQVLLLISGIISLIGAVFIGAGHVAASIQNMNDSIFSQSVKQSSISLQERIPNSRHAQLQQQYNKGEISFEIYQEEWKKADNP